jgi:hypothetical protein
MSGSQSDKVLDQNDHNIPYETIAKNFPWSSLSQQDRERLLSEAEKLINDPKGYTLLLALYKMIGYDDPWSAVKVLALAFRRSDSDLAKKQSILKSARVYMDKILESLAKTPQDTSKIQRYNSFLGDFQAMTAQTNLETGDFKGALQNYQRALATYQKNGISDRADLIQKQIIYLEQAKNQGYHLIPIEHLRNERAELEQEIIRLKNEISQQTSAVTQLQSQVSKHKETETALASKITAAETKYKKANEDAVAQEKQHQKIHDKLQSVEGSLQFLIALPKAAQAPLWVEVIRLALDQGKIDDLTRQAVERLSIPCPREALPVLVEIAARSPEPFTVDPSRIGPGMARWFALIAEARSLQKQDEVQSAQKLVEAWDAFFAAAGGNGND